MKKHKLITIIPPLLILCWLLYLGVMIWWRAHISVQPPIYDPLSYMQKAINFWDALSNGQLFNPFNLQPTVRPPGTILMSYPFGFTHDFRGYHFRSVFLPILCIVGAVYIVAGAHACCKKGNEWWTAAIALLFSSLPMYYHFDWFQDPVSPTRWGLVDNFHAGVAALAMAAFLRSVFAKSLKWLFLAVLLSSFTLIIKPSGIAVMGLASMAWVIVIMFEWIHLFKSKSPKRDVQKYFIFGSIITGITYCITITICVLSQYLSKHNISYAHEALAVMRKVLLFSCYELFQMFYKSAGPALLLWITLVFILLYRRLPSGEPQACRHRAQASGLLIGSAVIWTAGLWYMIVVQAGGSSQIRYFYPFMLMGAICVTPVAFMAWDQTSRLLRLWLVVLCGLPALNISALLATGNTPPMSWQRMSGVNVSVGQDRKIVEQAQAFLQNVQSNGENVQVYSFNSRLPSQIFESVGMYEEYARTGLPTFTTKIPTDWVNGFVVRTGEILESDYILINRYPDYSYDPQHMLGQHYDAYESEVRAFEIWASHLERDAGVETVSDSNDLRLLKIADRKAFNQAIEKFVAANTWRPEFSAANPPTWWSPDAVLAYAKMPALTEINFDDIFKIHALSISRVPSGLKVEVWWQELRQNAVKNKSLIFLHMLDVDGNCIVLSQILLCSSQPLCDERPLRYGQAMLPLSPLAHALAFGVCEPGGAFLLPDKGMTDWGGRRVVIPLAGPATGTKHD